MESLFRLRRFLDDTRPAEPKAGVCELCAAPLASRHWHVIETEARRLLCACRPCYLLFTHPGAAGGKFRSVSERVVQIPESSLGATQWESMGVPVGVAFFVRHAGNRASAFYPSPAGATQSGLPMEAWEELLQSHPLVATIEPEVEALLVCRRRGRSQQWIVPVDSCYELVGRIRRHWRGFEGGVEAWREIDAFFALLDDVARQADSEAAERTGA